MKSKLLFTVFFLFFSINFISSQIDGVQSVFAEGTISKLNNTIRMNGSNDVVELSKIKGSPYENDSFIMGKAANKKINDSKPYYLRYNIYNDIIEIKEDNNTIGLIQSLNIYAIMNNREYHYEIFSDDNEKTDEGYFILLYKSEKVNVYKRKLKEFIEEQPAKDSFRQATPASFKDSELYYFKKGRVLILLSTKKKEFIKNFPEHKNEITSYIKTKKINLKSEKDLIQLFKYYESLL